MGEGSEDVEALVSPELRQALLDRQRSWQEHQDVEDWDWSQRRLQRELDEPVTFL